MSVLTFIKDVLGLSDTAKLKVFHPIVAQINAFEPSISVLSDDELKGKTASFRQALASGTPLDDVLPEAFAVVREASKRVLGLRHYDVQLIGGIVLHQGKISEMKTGEGKTLVSTLPAYLNALEGKGVYVVTVNDYLARRDSEWMGKIFRFLGLTVGLIQANMPTQDRITAYQSDITYGTNNEFGFDYLRDNLAPSLEYCCQLRRHFAIVDEVDSILIDEARTPLIISGPVEDSTEKYSVVAKVARKLERDTHFTVEEKQKNIVLTEAGIESIESHMKIDHLYSVENMDLAHMMINCLKAIYLYKRDFDYVVSDGQVHIVDEFTGRILQGRRYSDGLHQAIEAMENVNIQAESQTLASVTFQNYFRMFPKLAGMTGTAKTEEEEFFRIYGLEVVSIPTHQPVVRMDKSDVIYKTKLAKYEAIVSDVKTLHENGQPVLVGTIAIETSELLSSLLKKAGVSHTVLNAKFHEKEADIIKFAGQKGAVTIATNMAGRGTDIVLGDGVKDLGGLCVIGSERHESRRIDNQLRGRSGRQGDPGMSRFYVSLEDDLMRLFGSDRIASVMGRLGLPDDTPIEHGLISRSIEKAQKKVEAYHFSIRKQIIQYDDVMNKQRETIYSLRHLILSSGTLDTKINELITTVVLAYLASVGEADKPLSDEDIHVLVDELKGVFPIGNLSDVFKGASSRNEIKERAVAAFQKLYDFRKSQYPLGFFEAHLTRPTLLMTVDKRWREHLYTMESLREGIGLRAYGQKDPLIEYKMEAYELFQGLLFSVAKDSLEIINRAQLITPQEFDQIKTEKLQELAQLKGDSLPHHLAVSQMAAGLDSPSDSGPRTGSGPSSKKSKLKRKKR